MTEGRKASRASKSNLPCPLSLARGLDLPLMGAPVLLPPMLMITPLRFRKSFPKLNSPLFVAFHYWRYMGSCVFCAPLDRYNSRHIDRLLIDVSVDISVEYRSMSTHISVESRSICRPRCVGWHIDQCISAEWWSTYRLRYLPIVGRYSGWYVDHWLSARYRSTDGGISVECVL